MFHRLRRVIEPSFVCVLNYKVITFDHEPGPGDEEVRCSEIAVASLPIQDGITHQIRLLTA